MLNRGEDVENVEWCVRRVPPVGNILQIAGTVIDFYNILTVNF